MTATDHTVSFRIADDAHAGTIEAVLEALGYDVSRESIADAPDPLALPIANAVKRFKLTPREAKLIELVVRYGSTPDQLAEKLGVSRATVKWHMHNLFAKSGTNTREALLRAVLRLTHAQPPPIDRTLESLTHHDVGHSFTLLHNRAKSEGNVYRGKNAEGAYTFRRPDNATHNINNSDGWTVQAS